MIREFWLTYHHFDPDYPRLSYSLNDRFEGQVNQAFYLVCEDWRIHLGVRGERISEELAREIAAAFYREMKAPG